MSSPSGNFRERWWFSLLAAGMAVGSCAIGYVLINGHHHEFNTAWEPPWGILISTYEFFVLASGGLFLVAGIGRLIGLPVTGHIVGRAIKVAAPALLIGIGTLAIEFSQPLHLAINDAVSKGFFLALGKAGFLFGLYLALLAAGYRLFLRIPGISSFFLALFAWIIVLAAIASAGRVLGLVEGLTFRESFPLARLTLSALVLGGALLPLVVRFGFWLRRLKMPKDARKLITDSGKLLALFIAALMAYSLAQTKMSVGPGHGEELFLMSGPLALNFWSLEVLIGMVVPALILCSGRGTPARVTSAGLLAVAGQFFMEYDRLIAGQLKVMYGSSALPSKVYFTYIPCLPKSLVVMGAFSFFLFLWTVAEKIGPPEWERF